MHRISIVTAKDGLCDIAEIETSLTQCIEKTLEHEHVSIPCDIYVMLTDDDGIRNLNEEHRGIDRPTDVLSFPMQDLTPGEPIEPSPLELDPETGSLMLGDIVISTEKAKAQAKEYGHGFLREMCFLAVHSTLHLLGYDHELSPNDEKTHFELQDQILESLQITRD